MSRPPVDCSTFEQRQPQRIELPIVDSLYGGTARRLVSTERRPCRPGKSATRASGPKYIVCSTSTILGTNGLNSADVPLSYKQTNKRGAVPCSTLYVSTATLNWIRSGAPSQCRRASTSCSDVVGAT